MICLHDCPFKGLGSLPEFSDLTPRCQIDSQLHDAAVRFDSSLHHAAIRFDMSLHHAAERFDSPLQSAAARFDTCCIMQQRDLTPRWKCSWKVWLPAASCSGKISATIIDLTPCCIIQRRDLTPCCKMQRRDLTPRYIRLRRDLTPRCIMQQGVKL